MAIEQNKPLAPIPMVKDYIGSLRRQLLTIVGLSGVVASIACAFLLLTSGALPFDTPIIWIVSVAVGIIASGCNFLIVTLASSPIRDLLRAIAHVAGEPLAGAIPNPHDKRYEKTGLGTALQTVYSLDSTKTSPQPEKPDKNSPVLAVIDRLHGGVVALNSSRAVVYASKGSPVHTVDGILQPQLLFSSKGDSLDAWLSECEGATVKAEKLWQRIPDRTADYEGQRIFDVYASYEKGSTYETVLTLVDMTDRYQADEEDLNFIAFAAHELRGPITVIRGYLDVLQDELGGMLADDQRELFYRLSVSASRLAGYINNILNTSRYDRRHLTLSLVPDSLADIYAIISDDMALRASSQNRLLSVTIPSDLPQIAADRTSLSEVISNLIDNAIKYSNEGGVITVTAAARGDVVDLSVEDHGIGMASSVVKNLFQKFYRSHRSRETVAGSGIGLYISKAIVESHGGTISVRSTEGQGSTFTVSLPTYASVADKLTDGGGNNNLISQGKGWIKNHSMYRG